jgi:hypothetical protein
VSAGELVCEECKERSVGCTEGWRALLVDLDDDGQDEVVVGERAGARAERTYVP